MLLSNPPQFAKPNGPSAGIRSRETKNATGATLQLLRCLAGGEQFLLPGTSVRAIRRWENVRPFSGKQSPSVDQPLASAAQVGQLDLAGQSVPVYSLATLLGLPVATGASQGPVLLFAGQAVPFAVQVDQVNRTLAIAEADLIELPTIAQDRSGRFLGSVLLEQELALVLAPNAIGPQPEMRWQAERISTPAPLWNGFSPAMEQHRLLCFTEPGGDHNTFFACSYRQLLEVAAVPKVLPLRNSHPCVTGLIAWRGRAVPLLSLPALLGFAPPAQPAVHHKIVVVRGLQQAHLFALPAGLIAPLSVPVPAHIQVERRIHGLGPFVRSAYQLQGGMLILPDLDQLLASTASQ